MSYRVMNLGCKVNRVESDSIASALAAFDSEAASAEEADVIVINTCTVTAQADKKTRKAVRRALAMNEQALVVVTGCAASLEPATYTALDKRIIVESDKSKVPGVVEGILRSTNALQRHAQLPALRLGDAYPTRVGIKVQDGCDNACTYCIVHTARGKATSRSFDDILAEASAYDKAGVREMVLTGINIGSYRSGGLGLADLLEALVRTTGQARFRVSSIEPCDIDRHLIEVLERSQGRLCRHLHLPLQSGSSAILKAMARPYDASFFLKLVEDLYAAIPSLSLSTDIIVGFPGETEEDFQRTLRTVRSCRFSKVHIFRYSQRKGTPAASLPEQVDSQVKAARAERLAALAKTLRDEDLERRKGQIETVLVESGGQAMTESYHRVAFDGDEPVGTLLDMKL